MVSQARIQFRVLGPLEVDVDGGAASLGGAKQRAVLAALLLEAGRVVSIERLVDAVWGESPPATARLCLEVYVSRLRRELADEAGVVLGTRTPGYMLRIDRDQLDLVRFEDLVTAGRGALAEGDPKRAAALLREGLALWRGPPLSDVVFESPERRDADRLEELRLAAVGDRIDADLALGRHASLIGELEALVAEYPLREQLRAQLMLGLYRSGRQADALAVYRQTRALLGEELGLEPGVALQQLERRILLHDAALDLDSQGDRSAGTGSETVVCPFKGLAFFESTDADYFFGREPVVADVVSRMVDGHLVGLVGASGVGKSSILRAGVLPALAAGALPGSEQWRLVLVRPGDHPVRALELALGTGGLSAAMAGLGEGERILLAVDQLEEVFTACQEEGERRAFMATLGDAAVDPERRVIVVVALRADFYGRCAGYARLARLLSASHVLVGPMHADELARAIQQPATRAGLDVDQTLVDALIADVEDEPGGLPLLSTTLVELWRLREDRHLRLASYQTSGGVRGAVARLAEQAFGELDATEQQVARTIMLRLAGGDSDSPVRRRVPLADFDVEVNLAAAHVLSLLTSMRLLAISSDGVEVSHEALFREWPRFRTWLDEDRAGRRLHAHLIAATQAWAASGSDPAELYRGTRLSAALDWAGQHHAQLNELERTFLTASREMNESDTRRAQRQNRRLRALLAGVAVLFGVALVAIVIAVHQRAKATTEAVQTKSRVWAAESLAQLTIDPERSILLGIAAVRKSPTTDAVFALRRALDVSPLRVRLPGVGSQSDPYYWGAGISYSPDGTHIAEGSQDGSVRIFEAATGRPVRTIRIGSSAPIVQYSPDGSRLAIAGTKGVLLVDPATGGTLLRTSTSANYAGNLAFSPDGAVLYFANYLTDRPLFVSHLYRWDLRSNRVQRLATGDIAGVGGGIGGGGFFFVQPTPDGHRLVVGGVPGVAVVDARNGRVLASTTSIPFIYWMALSPDGRLIAATQSPPYPAAARSGLIVLLDARTLRRVGTVGPPLDGDAYTALAFSPDGTRLAFGTNEGSAGVFDVQSRSQLVRFPGHTTNIYQLAFSPDGQRVATAAGDGRAYIWRAAGNQQQSIAIGVFNKAADGFLNSDLAFLGDHLIARFQPTGSRADRQVVQSWASDGTPDAPLPLGPASGAYVRLSGSGRFVVVGPMSSFFPIVRRVAVWDTQQRRVVGRATISGVCCPVLSHDGRRIAYGASADPGVPAPDPKRRLRIVDVASGKTLKLGASPCSDWTHIEFSRNDRRIAASSICGQVGVWDTSSGRQIGHMMHFIGYINLGPLQFSPDDSVLAVANSGNVGDVSLVEVSTGHTFAVLNHDTKGIQSVAFSPDGAFLATASLDGSARIWDAHTGLELRIIDDSAPLNNVAFSPDGRRVATLDYAGVINTWDACTDCQNPHALLTLAQKRITRQLTAAESRAFLG